MNKHCPSCGKFTLTPFPSLTEEGFVRIAGYECSCGAGITLPEPKLFPCTNCKHPFAELHPAKVSTCPNCKAIYRPA